MKCKYCGAEIGLEENFCQYCGRPNEQAARHSRDMASYHRRFAATEATVVNKTNRYRQIVLRIGLIFILMILTLVISRTLFAGVLRRRTRRSRSPGWTLIWMRGII